MLISLKGLRKALSVHEKEISVVMHAAAETC